MGLIYIKSIEAYQFHNGLIEIEKTKGESSCVLNLSQQQWL